MASTTSVKYLKGVGEQRVKQFAKLGVATLGDLVRFYPRSYEDWSAPLSILEAPLNQPCCIKARLLAAPTEHRVRKGMTLYKMRADDGKDGLLYVTLFNNKFLAQKLRAGEEYLFYGKTTGNLLRREMASPDIGSSRGPSPRPCPRFTICMTPCPKPCAWSTICWS